MKHGRASGVGQASAPGHQPTDRAWLTVVLALVLVSVAMALANGRAMPILMADEIAHLRVAAWLTGQDWTGVEDLLPWAAPLYGLLLTPWFGTNLSPATLYTGYITFNAITLGVTYLVACRSLRLLAPDTPQAWRLSAAMLALVYPASLANTQFVWAETLLLLATWATVLFAVLPRHQLSDWRWFADTAGLALIATLIHARALGLCVVIIALALIGIVPRAWSLRQRLLAATGAAAGTVSGWLLQTLLRHWMTSPISIGVQHAPSDAAQRSLDILLGNPSAAPAAVASGQVAYLVTATLGLVVLGSLPALSRIVRRYLPASAPRTDHLGSLPQSGTRLFELSAIGLAATAGALAVSTAFLMVPARFDHYFHGRYIEAFASPLIAAGVLVALLGHPRRRQLSLIVLAAFVLSATTIYYVWPNPAPRSVSYLMISGWSHLGFLGLLESADASALRLMGVGVVFGGLLAYRPIWALAAAACFFLMQQPMLASIYVTPRMEQYSPAVAPIQRLLDEGYRIDQIVVGKHAHWRLSLVIQMQFHRIPVLYELESDAVTDRVERQCIVTLPVTQKWPQKKSGLREIALVSSPYKIALSKGCRENP